MNSTILQTLDAHLVIRALQSREDPAIERLAAFHSSIFGAGVGILAKTLLQHHSASAPQHWLYVEDSDSDEIVAGLCLLDWRLDMGGVTLRAGEMGIVATDPRYRGRGLIRALNTQFSRLLQAGNYDLSIIQGIPYFYRQFDYAYTIPLEAWCRVELHQFNDPQHSNEFQFRRAVEADIPQLAALYQAAGSDLQIKAMRDHATWRYLLGAGEATETGAETWLIVGADAGIDGYVRVMHSGFGDGLICGEASQLSAVAAEAALAWLCELARSRNKPYLRLNLPRLHTLNRLAQSRGAADWRAYAWQVRILDPLQLLQKLAPLLEQRIAASPFAGLNRTVTINFYRQAIQLQFVNGQITTVASTTSGDHVDLRVPPDLAAPLLFGWRTISELNHIHPDLSAADTSRMLVETLFPPQEAFLYSIY